jgi:hypothetical protein
MRRLRGLPENENLFQREETLLLRSMSLQESIQHWLQLQSAFEWQLKCTTEYFAEERYKALAELQARLQRLVE